MTTWGWIDLASATFCLVAASWCIVSALKLRRRIEENIQMMEQLATLYAEKLDLLDKQIEYARASRRIFEPPIP